MESDDEFMAKFTSEEIRFGIDQYAAEKLGMTGDDFIARVKKGERVDLLHHRAQAVANLVRLLERRETTHADNE